MKTKQTFLKAFASLALAMGAFASADAQQNLGAGCGCPTVASRPTVIVSTLPGYVAINGTYGGELTQGASFTCQNTYILDKKIYIPSGQTLTIAPGTVIKGSPNASTAPQEATALVIERGGKIDAQGTASCPIVFTAFDDQMNNQYPISYTGKWGGVVILGRAHNNLLLASNGPFVPGGAGKLAVADGLGTVEGFASSNPQDQYGVALNAPGNVTAAIASPSSQTYTMDIALGTQVGGTVPEGATGIIGSNKIVLATTTPSQITYVLPGMAVTPVNGIIPAGTLVSSVSGQTITLSQNLAGTVTGPVGFTGTYPLAAGTTSQFFTVTTTPTNNIPVFSNNTYGPFNVSGGNVNFAYPYVPGSATGFINNDDSGTMKYVSIRYAGAILAVGAEINGLTLASVGSGTTIENIEIVSCADDNIEIFGGTVNLKYISTIFGNDDMLDWDLGWTGKCQFFFGMAQNSTTPSSPDADSGIEADSDDGKNNHTPRSHPIIRNATIIGRAKPSNTADNTGIAAITAKELTEGEIYSSIFANFKNGLWLVKSVAAPRTYPTGGESWHNWTNIAGPASASAGNGSQSLKVKCNTFVGITNPLTNGSTPIASGTPDYIQFTATDGNVVVAGNTLPGFNYNFTIDPANNSVSVKNDVSPSPAVSNSGCPTDNDQFWTQTNYRGAFATALGTNWLSNWSYSQLLGTTTALGAAGSCTYDFDGDGSINVADFLLFAPNFGTNCN